MKMITAYAPKWLAAYTFAYGAYILILIYARTHLRAMLLDAARPLRLYVNKLRPCL